MLMSEAGDGGEAKQFSISSILEQAWGGGIILSPLEGERWRNERRVATASYSLKLGLLVMAAIQSSAPSSWKFKQQKLKENA